MWHCWADCTAAPFALPAAAPRSPSAQTVCGVHMGGMGACAAWCCVDTDCGVLCDSPCTLSFFLSEVVVDRQPEAYVCMLPFARTVCLHYYACVCNQSHPQQCLLILHMSLKGVISDRDDYMRISTYFWQQSCPFDTFLRSSRTELVFRSSVMTYRITRPTLLFDTKIVADFSSFLELSS